MMAPFDAYQVLRGTKTLPVRMRQHERSAARIASFLEDHEAVTGVYYPGLESHPQHDLASEQMSGYGGVLSFEIDTDFDGAETFLQSLEEITLAVSLGGVESLAEHPASMTHSTLTPDEREEIGITDSLIRLSVGIEDVDDLIDDLDRALAATPLRQSQRAETSD
jgi:cystathionine gamma-lyase